MSPDSLQLGWDLLPLVSTPGHINSHSTELQYGSTEKRVTLLYSPSHYKCERTAFGSIALLNNRVLKQQLIFQLHVFLVFSCYKLIIIIKFNYYITNPSTSQSAGK